MRHLLYAACIALASASSANALTIYSEFTATYQDPNGRSGALGAWDGAVFQGTMQFDSAARVGGPLAWRLDDYDITATLPNGETALFTDEGRSSVFGADDAYFTTPGSLIGFLIPQNEFPGVAPIPNGGDRFLQLLWAFSDFDTGVPVVQSELDNLLAATFASPRTFSDPFFSSGLGNFTIDIGRTVPTGTLRVSTSPFDDGGGTAVLPLPATAWLLLSGLAGLGLVARRRSKRAN